MSNESSVASRSGMGCTTFFVVLLQVLFIGLKLTEQINWSWWTVFLPFMFYFGICLAMVFALILALIVLAVLDSK